MSCSKAINNLSPLRMIVIKLAIITIGLLILCAQKTVSGLITKIKAKGEHCAIDTILPSTDNGRSIAFQMTVDSTFRGTVF